MSGFGLSLDWRKSRNCVMVGEVLMLFLASAYRVSMVLVFSVSMSASFSRRSYKMSLLLSSMGMGLGGGRKGRKVKCSGR